MRRRAFLSSPLLLTASAAPDAPRRLANGYFSVSLAPDTGFPITGLRVDPKGTGVYGETDFSRGIAPENWEASRDTQARLTTETTGPAAKIGPLRLWEPITQNTPRGTRAVPERLTPGQTLRETFTVPLGHEGLWAAARLPTWNTTDAGATLRLRNENGTVLALRRIEHAVDNAYQEIRPPQPLAPGTYRVELSQSTGMIGWWGEMSDTTVHRVLRVSLRRAAGVGTLLLRLDGAVLHLQARRENPPTGNAARAAWRWRATWTRDGYDCTPKGAGVTWDRFFTDNQRYLPIEQLKRRANGGLAFDGCRWVEMEGQPGTGADLRIEAETSLRLHWEMEPRELFLCLDLPESTGWRIRVLPRRDSVPDSLPRFRFADDRLTGDVNRFWWSRAFSYPSPALPAAWFEWMALMRSWYAGPARDGEMRQLPTYPQTASGYLHTWRQDIGWPLRPQPTTDTRHADTNARYILACWRFWRWTGDDAWLDKQRDRLRAAMHYQLETLQGKSGLIVTESRDVQGRANDQGDNYWDILPFGHWDAYANIVFYASLQAMQEIEPRTDFQRLRALCYRRYDEMFWDESAGRYIGCVDADGERHDYGFTFVNLEALFYGLGDAAKAARIFQWLQHEPTSSGTPDTYTRWQFAPRATTIHNPKRTEIAPDKEHPSWWVSWWKGTEFGAQCQDGGAILYVSFYDLMARLRYRGPDDAWARFEQILKRWRMPDRLCGGSPLFRGETNQQEDTGSVGVDYPFPESGLVPCFLLYGLLGIEARCEGRLEIRPRLPRTLPFVTVDNVGWRGCTLTIRADRKRVTITGTDASGHPLHRELPAFGGFISARGA